MTTTQARLLLAASIALLLIVAAWWRAWPDDHPPRADLAAPTASAAAAAGTTTTRPPPPGPRGTTTISPSTTAPPQAVGPIEPIAIRIDAIGVMAEVVPVGLAPDRQMEIPPAQDVGWYRLGPRPGAGGSAVLAGHIDFRGERGAFFSLGSLQVGDRIQVIDKGLQVRSFVVSEREQVGKRDVDLARYFTGDGPPRLTLITCGGAFDRASHHYTDNIIITARPS